MSATKIDRRRELGDAYAQRKTPQLVDIPELPFLMVDGVGDPSNAPAYSEAIQALFTLSYGAKYAIKGEGGPDYRVMPFETLWGHDGAEFPERMEDWAWTAMIAQPDEVDAGLLAAIRPQAERKVAADVLDRVRLERFHEGRAAQALHVGPWSQEEATIARLHAFVAQQGLRLRGRHHEIYLSDPARTAPERIKTILRQPVAEAHRPG